MPVSTVVGKRIDFSDKSKFVSIVGTRNPTQQEWDAAFAFGKLSVLSGFIVVSGLADGIDTAAHCGALSVSGDFAKTVAILSTAPNEKVYPPKNIELAEAIKENGALVHCYNTIAPWTKEKFGPKQKRLAERSAMQAYFTSAVVAVNSPLPIHGGTRWAMNYGKHFGARVLRYGPDRKVYADPDYKIEKNLIWWDMEMNLEQVGQELMTGNYNYLER